MSEADHDTRLEQELAGLKTRYERLRDEQVRTEQNLENLSSRLDELRERARAEYGTDDPEELSRILAERRAENERLVAEYRAHVDEVESALAAIEARAAAESGPASGSGETPPDGQPGDGE